MTLAALAPERIRRLALLDIAPVDYKVRRHDTIFTAINAVTDSQVTRRQDAADVMRHYLQEEGVIQFLLKSFQDGAWLFNVPVLWEQYENIVGWQDVAPYQGPVMFIKGGFPRTFRTAIARRLRASSLMPAPMSSQASGTGCMQKNPNWCYARCTVF